MTTMLLSDDEVRDLFSDHLEGALDADTARAVDLRLQASTALAAEHRTFARTLELLAALPLQEPSPTLVSQVRTRLAHERRADSDVADSDVAATDTPTAAPWWSPLRLTAGFAAAAAVVAIVMVAQPAGSPGPAGMLGAAMGEAAVSVSWQVPGIDGATIRAAAAEAGMQAQDDTWTGDRQTAARFFVALKARAATLNSTVSGAVPEHVEQLVVRIER